MTYQAKILRLDNNIKEEVDLQIKDVKITCFIATCPYSIKVGLYYPVQLSIWSLDRYNLIEIKNNTGQSINRLGNTFAYSITGKLCNGNLVSKGLVFEDKILKKEFTYLEGKMISIKADRINVEFEH